MAAEANPASPFPGKSDDFWVSLGVALLMMFVTEIGDKTFIISAVFGSVKERLVVILAVEVTVAVMILVNVTAGDVAADIAGAGWVNVATIACYILFGIMFLRDAWYRSSVPQHAMSQGLIDDNMPLEPIEPVSQGKHAKLEEWLDVFWKVGVCAFLSEWGDRTQFTAYHLSQEYHNEGVIFGCLMGQILCTILAAIGGRYFTSPISPRKTMTIGGVVFLCLAAYVYLWNPSSNFVTSK